MSEKFVNTLTVSGEKSEIKQFKKFVYDGDDDYITLHNILPIPSDSELEKFYGAEGFSGWCMDNWGTPCDVMSNKFEQKEGELTYHFFSVEAPPIKWLQAISKEFSDLEFELLFMDEYGDAGDTVLVKSGKINKLMQKQ